MSRVLLCLAALALVSGGSLASTSADVSALADLQSGLPTLSGDLPTPAGEWHVNESGQPFANAADAEVIHVAFKKAKRDGNRGGAKRKNVGGFNKGNKRNALRGAEPGRPGRVGDRDIDRRVDRGIDRDVDIDRRVDIDRDIDIDGDVDFDDDDDEGRAAIVGGVIGMGLGAAIANSDDPDYVCVDSNCGE